MADNFLPTVWQIAVDEGWAWAFGNVEKKSSTSRSMTVWLKVQRKFASYLVTR